MNHKYIFLDAVDSTNSYLLEHDEPEGTVCASLNQTAGRGRSSRQWIAQPGDCLAFSMCLPSMPANKLMGAQIAAGYAVVESILPWLDSTRLKWPNDLVYQGKKLAGLLIETRFIGSAIKKAIFGVGININAVAPAVRDRAIAIKDISDADIDIEALVERIAGLLADKLEQYIIGRLDIRAEWPRYSANYMKPVSVHINGSKTSFIEAGITENGYMITADGDIITEGEIGF